MTVEIKPHELPGAVGDEQWPPVERLPGLAAVGVDDIIRSVADAQAALAAGAGVFGDGKEG